MNEKQKRLFPALFILLSLAILIISLKRSESNGNANVYHVGKSPSDVVFLSPVFSYPQKMVTRAFSGIENFAGLFRRKGELITENRLLKESLIKLTGELQELKEYESENRQLRKLLQFREREPLRETIESAVGAEVIGRDPSNWYQTVLIDKGINDGIKLNAPVLTHQGLVGRIKKTGSASSVAMLILDGNSSISALIQRTREQGIVRGGFENVCRMEYLSGRVEVKYGDIVLTCGLGGIYPKDIIVGKVIGIEKTHSGLLQSAVILPAVEFSRLENVLVVK